RWMTLGMKARNTANGRMIGNIYVLHDEPLAPAEALSLDRDYIEYVIHCTRHRNKAVAKVARLISDELAENGVLEAPTRLDVLDQRAERQRRAEFPMETQASDAQFCMKTQANSLSFPKGSSQFPSKDTPSSQRKLSAKTAAYEEVSMRSVSTPVRSYTKSVFKTTAREEISTPLVWSWPLELTSDERKAVSFLLTGLPNDVQQAVIDEAAGRLEAGKVKSPVGFLHTLAKRAMSDQFQVTHFGRSIAERRDTSVFSQAPTKKASIAPPTYSEKAPEPSKPQPISAETEKAREAMFKRLGLRR
ncbi:STY4528 family pathogenicity island replication protein, partial [Halomonas sp. BBD48]|nr:STY4528 family pathogenicity island replication protein [Halomonas sp. BBD48]